MKRYRLKADDLRELKDVTTRSNPYSDYRAATVTLYLIAEVHELATRKQHEKEAADRYKQEHAAEIAAEKQQRAHEARREAADEAARLLESYQAVGSAVDAEGGSFKLQAEVLEVILDKVVSSTATMPYRVKHCAQQLATLSLVCTDIYRAVHSSGLDQLASTAAAMQSSQPLPASSPTVRHRRSSWQQKQTQLREQLEHLRALPGPSCQGLTWEFWDLLASDPQGFDKTYKVDVIKKAAKLLGQKVTGNKAELVVRLMSGLGLKKPAAAPAQLLVVMEEQQIADCPTGWPAPCMSDVCFLSVSLSAREVIPRVDH